MSYRHMNFVANISWNKKERVWAALEERCPRRRPINRDEIPACTKWNQFARWIDKGDDYHSIEDFVTKQTSYDDPEDWFKHLMRQAKEDNKHGRGHRWGMDTANLEEDRTDRQMQGGSRKKGGRVGWPSTKKIT